MPSNSASPICRPTKAAFPKRPTNKLRTREYPPVDSCSGDKPSWIWKTSSPVYRRRVKKATEMVKTYRLNATGSDHLDRRDKDAVHRLLDALTFDSERRMRSDGGAREILSDGGGTPSATS